jgi:hypothetical protein
MYEEMLMKQAARCRIVAASAEARGRMSQAEYLRRLADTLESEVAEIRGRSGSKPTTPPRNPVQGES